VLLKVMFKNTWSPVVTETILRVINIPVGIDDCFLVLSVMCSAEGKDNHVLRGPGQHNS
jgi:hypothetical protein